MYENYFGLDGRPFDLAPDPQFLFPTEGHARAVADLKFALTNHDSFVILTGEIGNGKTTVLNTVFEELGGGFVTARITHTTLNNIELLQALLSEFGKPMYTQKRVLLLDTLRDLFLEKHEQQQHVVIIVDEAQKLIADALEELRLLSCIDSHDRRIVTIVLTGSTELDEVVDAPNLVQLRQRVRLRQRLRPLTEEETTAYIRHRLSIVGGDIDAIFELDAVKEIFQLATGIPRLINTLCDTAMLASCVNEQGKVTRAIVDETVRELRWHWDEENSMRAVTATKEAKPIATGAQPTVAVYRDGKLIDQTKIKHFPFLIGRGTANDLIVIEREVSRRHALIDYIAGVFFIEDLNSKNGTQVNGERTSRALLRSGDVVSVGQVDIVFSEDAAVKRPPKQRAEPEDSDDLPLPTESGDDTSNVAKYTEH